MSTRNSRRSPMSLVAIPRYITGSERLGGAGRTAIGLAMLMGNAAKILQTVAANIDNDVIEPAVTELYDLVMLTDQPACCAATRSIVVLGVNVAMQRETQRQRQLEFLQITANPIDMQITGIKRPRRRAALGRRRASACRARTSCRPTRRSRHRWKVDRRVAPCPERRQERRADQAHRQLLPEHRRAPGAPGAPQGPQTNVVGKMPGPKPGAMPNPAQGPA